METAPGLGETLRPLGLGEILDRAVNVTVKYFVLFALIAAVFAVPEVLIQYFAGEQQAALVTALAEILKSGGKHSPAATLSTLPANPVGWTLASVGWFFLVVPIMQGAMIAAVGARYLGQPVTAGSAYRIGLGRWAHLVGVNVMYVAAGALAYVVFAIVIIVIVLVAVMMIAALKAAGIALTVVISIAAGLVVLAAAIVVLLAYKLSFIACVLEQKGFIAAFASGLERVFNRTGWRRTLLMGLAYWAILLGLAIVAMLGTGTLYALIPNRLIGAIFAALVGLGASAFEWAILTVFYFDLRVREEGLDLQLAARDLTAGPALQP